MIVHYRIVPHVVLKSGTQDSLCKFRCVFVHYVHLTFCRNRSSSAYIYIYINVSRKMYIYVFKFQASLADPDQSFILR